MVFNKYLLNEYPICLFCFKWIGTVFDSQGSYACHLLITANTIVWESAHNIPQSGQGITLGVFLKAPLLYMTMMGITVSGVVWQPLVGAGLLLASHRNAVWSMFTSNQKLKMNRQVLIYLDFYTCYIPNYWKYHRDSHKSHKEPLHSSSCCCYCFL